MTTTANDERRTPTTADVWIASTGCGQGNRYPTYAILRNNLSVQKTIQTWVRARPDFGRTPKLAELEKKMVEIGPSLAEFAPRWSKAAIELDPTLAEVGSLWVEIKEKMA